MNDILNNIGKPIKILVDSIKKLKPEYLLILIIIFALIIRMNFFLGMNLNDDLCYLNSAHEITQGEFDFDEWIFTPRLMMHYPIAFFYSIFSISDFSGAFYILLCSLGSVIVAYYIGKTLFDSRTGLASAFLMAIFPIEVIYATTIVPDVPVAFFMGLSVCLFLIGEKSDKKLFYFFAGISIGLAWLVKSLSILIILFYLSYFLLDKLFDFKHLLSGVKKKSTNKFKQIFSIRLGFILTALGFAIVLFFEGLIYLSARDNFFLRYEIESEHYVSTLLGCNFDLNYYPRMLLIENSTAFNYFGFFFIFFCTCIFLFLLFDRNRKILIFIVWFLVLYMWMQYGTMNLNEFVLMHRIYRFTTVWTIPIAVTIGYFIAGSKINKKRIFSMANIIIISVLLITSFCIMKESHEFKEQVMIDFKETANFLKNYPDKDIYADYDTRGKLDFLLGYERTHNLKYLEWVKNASEIEDAFVLVDVSRGFAENPSARETLPDFIYNPPENWEVKKIITAANMGSYARWDPIIYYVPPQPIWAHMQDWIRLFTIPLLKIN